MIQADEDICLPVAEIIKVEIQPLAFVEVADVGSAVWEFYGFLRQGFKFGNYARRVE